MQSGKILVVDDDPSIHAIFASIAPDLGLKIESAMLGKDGLERALADDFELVVLDLGLEDIGGMVVLAQLRAQCPALPILLLTSRSGELDKVLGLESGADDYLTKPFGVHELVARVRALIRRKSAYLKMNADSASSTETVVVSGDLEVDFRSRVVKRGGEPIVLSSLEFDIVAHLIRNRDRVVSREELLTEVWGYSSNGIEKYDATVSTNLSRIRSKIEANPETPRHIITVRGVGYRFVDATGGENSK